MGSSTKLVGGWDGTEIGGHNLLFFLFLGIILDIYSKVANHVPARSVSREVYHDFSSDTTKVRNGLYINLRANVTA